MKAIASPRGMLPAPCCLFTIAFLPADAATISTGAACSLVQAVESANTNAAIGGCNAGAGGHDRIIVTSNVTLSAANNGLNGLPVVIEDLTITTPGDTRIIQSRLHGRDTGLPLPGDRHLGNVAASVTISNILFAERPRHGRGRSLRPGRRRSGGCIFLRNGGFRIADSIVQECVAEGDDNPVGNGASASGGAIYAVSGTLEIRNSSFSLNNAYAGDAGAAGFFGGAGGRRRDPRQRPHLLHA